MNNLNDSVMLSISKKAPDSGMWPTTNPGKKVQAFQPPSREYTKCLTGSDDAY